MAADGERACAETELGFAFLLADVFEGYEPRTDVAGMAETLEWSTSLRRWNDLQSERYRIAEDEDRARLSLRYHAWGTALGPDQREMLRDGTVALEEDVNGVVLVLGSEARPTGIRMRLTREDGCYRVDEN